MALDLELVEKSKTRQVKAIFPSTTNHYHTLFGGTALQGMDEVAFIVATRYSRQKMVTVSLDRIDFKQPIPAGYFAELVGEVVMVGKSSMRVRVDIFLENMYRDERKLAVSGMFTMVAVGEDKKPVTIRKAVDK